MEASTEPAQAATATNGPATGLWAKLAVAQQALAGGIGKAGRNKEHGYDYTTAEDVVRAANKAVREAGLVASNSVTSSEQEKGQTKKGTGTIIATVEGVLRITDPGGGETAEFPWVGVGIDVPGDKAVYKAITGGTKYAWQMALQLAFGDDPENDSAPGATSEHAALPAWTQPGSDELRQSAARAVKWLVGPNAKDTWERILSTLNAQVMPRGVAQALVLAVGTRKQMDEATEPVSVTQQHEPGAAEAAALAGEEGDGYGG